MKCVGNTQIATNQCLDTVGSAGSQLMQYTCGQAAPVNVQDWTTSPPPPQYKSYEVVNCNDGIDNGGIVGSTMAVWARDVTANGSFEELDDLQGRVVGDPCGTDHDFPDDPDSYTFRPQTNHIYEVRVIEVDNFCPTDSPTSGCFRSIATFQGNPNGQTYVLTIGN
jgi:hypothetical protein